MNLAADVLGAALAFLALVYTVRHVRLSCSYSQGRLTGVIFVASVLILCGLFAGQMSGITGLQLGFVAGLMVQSAAFGFLFATCLFFLAISPKKSALADFARKLLRIHGK